MAATNKALDKIIYNISVQEKEFLNKITRRRDRHAGFSQRHPLIINGRIFAQQITGVQRYGIEVIRQIDKMVKPGEVILALPYGDLVTQPFFTNIKAVRIGKGNGNKWTQFWLPFYALKKGGTILNLAGIAPVIKPDYTVAHDISFIRYPKSYGKQFRILYRIGFFLTLYRCRRIITISKFSRDELIAYYRLDKGRFVIAGNSAEHMLDKSLNKSKDGSTEQDNEILAKWGLKEGEKYYLSVGSKNLHKNQNYIIKLAAKYPEMKFIVVGGDSRRSFSESGNAETTIIETDKGYNNLIFTGYVTEKELQVLYTHAFAFIFSSLYEGFGIPPMEAIALGIKHVAVSDIPVLREIYPKGCYFFNPEDTGSFDMKKLNEVEMTEDIRGYYLKKYSWEKSARTIIDAIK